MILWYQYLSLSAPVGDEKLMVFLFSSVFVFLYDVWLCKSWFTQNAFFNCPAFQLLFDINMRLRNVFVMSASFLGSVKLKEVH